MNTKKAKILIVEDEKHINRLIELVLLSDGYSNIQKAFDGEEAFELIKQSKPDLILLDIMIPKIDGFTLCRKIKQDNNLKDIRIIVITAKTMENDILTGFEKGAADYITKPFNNKILLARINAHLQNYPLKKENKNLFLNKDNSSVIFNGNEIKLTKFEFKLMTLFINNMGRVFSRSQLLEYLRGDDGYEISERAMDVHIVNLRKKLGSDNIETVRGLGYKLKDLQNE